MNARLPTICDTCPTLIARTITQAHGDDIARFAWHCAHEQFACPDSAVWQLIKAEAN